MEQFSASPIRMVYSMAVRLGTGSDPGRPRHTGQTCVFGSPPNVAGQPQNSLVAVPSSTWVSSPISGSYLLSASSKGTRPGATVLLVIGQAPSLRPGSDDRAGNRAPLRPRPRPGTACRRPAPAP